MCMYVMFIAFGLPCYLLFTGVCINNCFTLCFRYDILIISNGKTLYATLSVRCWHPTSNRIDVLFLLILHILFLLTLCFTAHRQTFFCVCVWIISIFSSYKNYRYFVHCLFCGSINILSITFFSQPLTDTLGFVQRHLIHCKHQVKLIGCSFFVFFCFCFIFLCFANRSKCQLGTKTSHPFKPTMYF